ncbi:hypothetical protein ADUPG1_006137 [Aduncisulcus paluster]|uniref:Uncharacterized protein n=1 Tax=Aduncisulcus paluster TaxID=2918883 RepID=A0ABQ5KLH2_9EUKA|nr:hypothetical protein ADUPG1_006137 [Aduncisulcus paluster]
MIGFLVFVLPRFASIPVCLNVAKFITIQSNDHVSHSHRIWTIKCVVGGVCVRLRCVRDERLKRTLIECIRTMKGMTGGIWERRKDEFFKKGFENIQGTPLIEIV